MCVCVCARVYANYGHVAVLLIRFTSDYQGYKRNERPWSCAISEATLVPTRNVFSSFHLFFFGYIFFSLLQTISFSF